MKLKCLEKSSHIVVLSTLEIPFNLTADGILETFLFFRTKSQKYLGLVQYKINAACMAFLRKKLVPGAKQRKSGVIKRGHRCPVSVVGFPFLNGQTFKITRKPRKKLRLLEFNLRDKTNITKVKSIIKSINDFVYI